jgi:hypothetical protein
MAIAQGGQRASAAVPMPTTAAAATAVAVATTATAGAAAAAPTTAVLMAADHPQDPPPSPYTSNHPLLFLHSPIIPYPHLHFYYFVIN